MTIMFKWDDETYYGRVERKASFRPNVVIGKVEKVHKGMVAFINIGGETVRLGGLTAKAVKAKIANALNNYANEKVVVYSIFDQKQERPIEIRRGDVGGCCDPSTELYHTM